MKYLLLVIGIVALGLGIWGIWGYLDDIAYENKCGNPRGSMDCVPPLRIRATGELAMPSNVKTAEFSELIVNKSTWAIVIGAAVVIYSGILITKGIKTKDKKNVR